MKYYFSLYKHILVLNLSLLFAHRANLVGHLIGTVVWTALSIITMLIISEKTKVVAGWHQSDLLLLTGGLTISVGIFSFFFKKSFQRFPEVILYGELDGILLKPVDSQFLSSMLVIHFPSLIRVLLGIGFVWYVIVRFHVSITLIGVLSFSLFLCIGVIIYYCLWMVASTLLIWFPRLSNILDVMNSLNQSSRFPPEGYQSISSFLFLFFLPYTFILATPVNLLLQRASVWDILSMLLCTLVLVIVSRKFWQYALRYYGSASG